MMCIYDIYLFIFIYKFMQGEGYLWGGAPCDKDSHAHATAGNQVKEQ